MLGVGVRGFWPTFLPSRPKKTIQALLDPESSETFESLTPMQVVVWMPKGVEVYTFTPGWAWSGNWPTLKGGVIGIGI